MRKRKTLCQWRNASRPGYPLRAKEHGRSMNIQRDEKEGMHRHENGECLMQQRYQAVEFISMLQMLGWKPWKDREEHSYVVGKLEATGFDTHFSDPWSQLCVLISAVSAAPPSGGVITVPTGPP